MNDDIKFNFWLKLNVELITPKEIQVWANEKILEDNNDQFILDICFLKNDEEIRNYLTKLRRVDFIIDETTVAINILKEYISKESSSNLYEYIANIDLIASHIRDPDLTDLLSIYGNQIELASLGYLKISVEQAFNEFLQHLNKWLEQHT
ncbi:hypothetical protein OZX61_12410 (plasmid) [Acinetobacter sp. ESL0695]|uniref:hypothetical protein n=1 Tax=Acinetobacter sp. ESL0695 TaxID=2983215 RepID=UPI0023F4EC2D|nr:hypothetical protein [Acinetobacter sp. ESL0695]WEV50133.1 hypothetical protein OZX61_12410 [Acinetobacter sp. ESL0695]